MKKPSKMPTTVAALKRELTGVRHVMQEGEDLSDRMAKILRETADALHGGSLDDGYWSWHDLPSLATSIKIQLDTALAAAARNARTTQELLLYIRTMPDPVQVKAGTAYADMVESCQKAGLAPMTPEEFRKEDKRLMVDWNRRRHGVDPGLHMRPQGFLDGDLQFRPVRGPGGFWDFVKLKFRNPFKRRPLWGKY